MLYYYSSYLVFVLPFILLSMWAQYKVKATFETYSKLYNQNGWTGAEAARRILDQNGLQHVTIEHIPGTLTDHFDPKTNTVRLSDAVYGSHSVAAVGVAAHESGHAVQHARKYAPIMLRNSIVPVVNFGSRLSIPLLLLGMLLQFGGLIWLGIFLFSFAVLFQLITLPVEFNASRRAIHVLEGSGYLTSEEQKGVRKVLTAAAMTYVAAALTSIGQLLQYISIFGRKRN